MSAHNVPETEPRSDDGTVVPLFGDRLSIQAEPPIRELIGEVLREERHRQERTLGEVAADAGVSLPYLSEVERGTKEVSSDVLRSILVALDLPLVDVLERSAIRVTGTQRNSVLSLAA